MASDRERYTEALANWQTMLDANNVSAPVDLGRVAIMIPYSSLEEHLRRIDERMPALNKEAFLIAGRYAAKNRGVNVFIDADTDCFAEVLDDRTFSDIVVVGHGCLSSVEIHPVEPDVPSRIDWEDLASIATHLKTGLFVQRTCARLPRNFNAPLGLFTVTDHRNVLAPVGKRITNNQSLAGDNKLYRPVTDKPVMSYDDIKRELPRQTLSASQKARVQLGAVRNRVKGLVS